MLGKMSETRGEVAHGAEARERRPENFPGFLSLGDTHSGHAVGKGNCRRGPILVSKRKKRNCPTTGQQ